jgi:hypothetical protein
MTTAYRRAVEALLKALFYPELALPEREMSLHAGRKRIDLTFANQATSGFFAWVAKHHPAMYIIIECKNYSGDPENPELDQIAGRFGPSRGKVGLLLCRSFEDKELFHPALPRHHQRPARLRDPARRRRPDPPRRGPPRRQRRRNLRPAEEALPAARDIGTGLRVGQRI